MNIRAFIFLLLLFLSGCVDQARLPASRSDCIDNFLKILRTKVFEGEINHPDFYLWDNWAIEDDGVRHLYSMAAERTLSPPDRHLHAHWRHFISYDYGKSWIDKGAVLEARVGDFMDNQAIWSGSVTKIKSGEVVAAYTGLSSKNHFLQSISLAVSSDFHHFKRIEGGKPILSHITQRKKFLDMGYYVDELNKLGSKMGEANGSIQALRDPFLFQVETGEIHLFWSAKAFGKKKEVVSAIGHARISDIYKGSSIDILSPIIPPDSAKFTQLELPNVTRLSNGKFAWITSTTNRISEAQKMNEIDPQIRLYFSESLDGKLVAYRDGQSSLMKSNQVGIYGANLVQNSSEVLLRTFNLDNTKKSVPLTLPRSIRLRDLMGQ